MAIILRDTPPSYVWGWYSNDAIWMHLRAMSMPQRSRSYIIWLEADGN